MHGAMKQGSKGSLVGGIHNSASKRGGAEFILPVDTTEKSASNKEGYNKDQERALSKMQEPQPHGMLGNKEPYFGNEEDEGEELETRKRHQLDLNNSGGDEEYENDNFTNNGGSHLPS